MVTIITPTWNRGVYINRVWDGLRKQSYQNIEWIVCDDGSEDDTLSIINKIKSLASLSITILHARNRVGKTRLDNAAIKAAKGEFIVWNDSDDYFVSNGIEKLVNAWLEIPEEEKESYIGIVAQCKNIDGALITNPPITRNLITTFNDLREKFKYSGDMVYFTKSSSLKANIFPEVDFVIPEGVVWTALGSKYIKVIPDVVKIVEYKAINCISYSGRMEYCRGKAYAIPIIKKNTSKYNSGFTKEIWQTITYMRYCIHGEIEFKDMKNLSSDCFSKYRIFFLYIFSLLLAIGDNCQGKVKKTHIDFNNSRKIEIQRLTG